jgi:hypothetical protein
LGIGHCGCALGFVIKTDVAVTGLRAHFHGQGGFAALAGAVDQYYRAVCQRLDELTRDKPGMYFGLFHIGQA